MKIGVVLPLGWCQDPEPPPSYAAIRALAVQAEEDGLDSVWVHDHFLYRFPDQPTAGAWEAWTVLSALAEATHRIELGALVICTAFRNPALLAKMAITLDAVSGHRLILGLGAGWHEPEFDAFGVPIAHKVDRFKEALQIIIPLVKEGSVDFTGQHYAAPKCEMLPRPARPIPIVIGARQARMHRLAARYADGWNTAWHGQVNSLADRWRALAKACATVGRDPSTLEVTAGVNVAFPDLGDTPAETGDQGLFLTGSAEQIAADLRRYADAGVGHVICTLYPLTSAAVFRLACAGIASRAGR